MPYCRRGDEFPEARASLGFDCCLECGNKEAAAEIAHRAQMIAPISHKSGYTYLGSDEATQRQRLARGLGQDTPDGNWCSGDRPRRPAQAGKAQALRTGRLGV
jgi:hypothetical protein